MTTLFLTSILTVLFGGILSILISSVDKKFISKIIAGGSFLGLIPTLNILLTGKTLMLCSPAYFKFPIGELALEVDFLSSVFLLPIFLLSGICAIYANKYLKPYAEKKNLNAHWFLYSVFVSSMALVVCVSDSIAFLVFWEIMTIASFFLVTFNDEKPSVREAGWLYLILSHIGVAFLSAIFILLGGENGNTLFSTFTFDANTNFGIAIFILALLGFGLKAGIMPLHVWLPRAHPAAPAHISALMSGVMIKLGIYGLLRVIGFAENTPLWWGETFIILGAISGIVGILYALTQSDLKKILAFSSIENIGIIILGIGVSLIGTATNNTVIATCGLLGALLHIINHSIFKGLLFLGAGSIQLSTGTRNIEQLGGLLKRMPKTGFAFLIGSIAICGLPPFNGFVGEFFIYVASLNGISSTANTQSLFLIVAITSLAIIGALSIACFTRLFGFAFLGEPKSECATNAKPEHSSMALPLNALALLCLIVGVALPFMFQGFNQPESLVPYIDMLKNISYLSFLLFAVAVLLAYLRKHLLSKHTLTSTGTWDCGYSTPTAKMQYSASSYSQPIIKLFENILRPREKSKLPNTYFPDGGFLFTKCTDTVLIKIYRPAFKIIRRTADYFKVIQYGSTHLYVLYITIILAAFMFWKLR